jgi:sarcosine oxidase
MKDKFDAIVIGLGAMGSAAVYQLARRNKSVLGIERFSPPHDYGSTHGESRIIRKAIGEGEQYVPLALRSYELFREIEKAAGIDLLTITGGLTLESPDRDAQTSGGPAFLDRAIGCARKFGIRHEMFETRDIQKRYPQFAVTDERGYFEYDTGYLRPERCIEAQLELAQKCGATVHTGERVLSVVPGSSKVTVQTNCAAYASDQVILAAGPWIAEFLPPEYAAFFKAYRQVMYWFTIRDQFRSMFLPARFPIFIWVFGTGKLGFYGFPSLDGKTIKLAGEQYDLTTGPDAVDRAVSESEKGTAYSGYVEKRLPGLSGSCASAATCLYTATPDGNFVIDFHPESDRIIVASPCSGHGFKHSAAIGEALAELVVNGASRIDISSFKFKDRGASRDQGVSK